MTERQHTAVAIVLVIMGLYLMRISAVEIQPTPEAEIALRAESIVRSQQWMDVSTESIGGLSTSATPPLPSWVTAVGITLLGPSTIAVRFGAVLAIIGVLVLSYGIARRALPYTQALMVCAVVGLSTPMITVGRQMTPELMGLALVMLCWWSIVQLLSATGTRARVGWMLVYAIGLGGALLTSLPLTAIAVLLSIPVILNRQTLLMGIGGVLLGLLVGVPWYLTMITNHGSDFLLALSTASTASVAVTGGFHTGPLDVVALLVLSSPVLVAALIWVIAGVRYRDVMPARTDVVMMTAGLWFLGMMVLVAISRHHTMLAMVPVIPAATIVSFSLIQSAMQQRTPGLLLTTLAGIVLSVTASVLVYSRLVQRTQWIWFVLGIEAVLLLGVFAMSAARRQRLAVRLTKPIINGALALTALVALGTIMFGSRDAITGARTVGLRMLEDTLVARNFVYLFHRDAPTDNINQQLAWYTRGWMSGRNPRFAYVPLAMPTAVVDPAVVRASVGAPWIVYYHPGIDENVSTEVFEILDAEYSVAEETPHYVLFERRLRMRR